jgi:competence protein ComEC
LGDTRGIDRDRWRDFRHLGVVHILVISGLHIGLLAAMCQLILGLPRRFVTFQRDCGRSRFTAVAVLVITGSYAALVGATLPVTRAYLMLAMTQVPTILGWSTRSERALLLALVAMVLWNPRVLLGASFWLSACATWLLVCGLRGDRGRFGVLALQLKMVVFLMPLTLFWFGEASWLGIATNLVLVPLVTMVMVPLGLIGLLLSEWAPSLAECLWWLCRITWESLVPSLSMVLRYCRSAGVIQSGLSWIGLSMGVLAIGLWAHYPRRAMALLLGAALSAVEVNGGGEAATLTVLDVGQGLALIVQSGDRALLYDTGDGRPDQLTQADKVLLPYFRQYGINALDTVIISHGDRDHSGGLDVIRQQIPIGRHLGFAGEPCRNGERWRWESVEFLILNGTGQDALSRNDQSCALLISTAEARVLVLGDMSSSKERELVLFWRDALAATHLVVAHHGSRSSTSYALLKWARPDWALISAGFANAFGHPHDEVLERLARAGQPPAVLNTATAGAVALRLDRGGGVAPVRQRTRWSPYWLTVP